METLREARGGLVVGRREHGNPGGVVGRKGKMRSIVVVVEEIPDSMFGGLNIIIIINNLVQALLMQILLIRTTSNQSWKYNSSMY